MGNDGGSIPKRSEVVKKRRNKVELDKKAKNFAKSSLCAMSKEPLRKPIVVCKRGLLYNKEHLIKRILEKNMPKEFRHIIKLSRDTCQVSESSIMTETTESDSRLHLQCAISQQTLNGIVKFVIGFKCGCVLSQASLDILSQTAEEVKEALCPACSAPQGQLVSLN